MFVDSPNYAIRENKDFLKNFVHKEPNFRAGEKIYYNNCAFILLGLVIDKITKQSYREFITEEIFELFHMRDTFLWQKKTLADRLQILIHFIRTINNSDIYRRMLWLQTEISNVRNDAYSTMGFGFDS